MKALICGSVTLLYLLSIISQIDRWNKIYLWITLKMDLSPVQIPLIPITFNLFAIGFGMPSVIFLCKNKSAKNRGSKQTWMASLCTVGVCLLLCSVIRWIIYSPQSLITGIPELFQDSSKERQKDSTILNGCYENHQLGISFNFPTDWHILSPNAIKRAHVAGTRRLTDTNSEEPSCTLPEGVKQFFSLKKFPETHQEHNPSILLVSYEKIKMRQNNILNLYDMMQSYVKPAILGNTSTMQAIPVGEFDGLLALYSIELAHETVEYYIYAFETNSHYVTITIVAQNAIDHHALKKVASTMKKWKSADGNIPLPRKTPAQ